MPTPAHQGFLRTDCIRTTDMVGSAIIDDAEDTKTYMLKASP